MSRKYKKVFILFLIVVMSGILMGCHAVFDRIYEEVTELEAEPYESPAEEQQEPEAGNADAGIADAGNPFLEAEAGMDGKEQDEDTGGEVNRDIRQAQSSLYYFETHTGEEQDLYAQIYEAITTREDKILATVDTELVDRVYQSVMNDHPEIFYSAGYELEKQLRNDKVIRIIFRANYHMTREEETAATEKIKAYVARCFGAMTQGLDEYGQVKYIYEYIISNTEYRLNSENNQNICSVFLNGKSVCQGYAKAAQYLLRELGFEITLAFGKVQDGDLHTWNLVRVDGDYYFMDPTWGDAGYLRQDRQQNTEKVQPVNYEYFLITTEQLSKTHRIDNMVPLPDCVATRNNYYVREGIYFTFFDEQKMTEAFEKAYEEGQDYVTVMCGDPVIYEEMKQRMISGQEVFRYMHASQSVSYSYNDDLYTFIFWLQ